MNRVIKFSGIVLLVCCFVLTGQAETSIAASGEQQSFKEWLDSFYSVAAENGITRATYDRAFAGVTTPDEKVLEKAA